MKYKDQRSRFKSITIVLKSGRDPLGAGHQFGLVKTLKTGQKSNKLNW